MAEELKACRNCGGQCDPTGWMCGDGRQGPECEGCGITTPDIESWNRLMGEQLPSQGGEAVGVMHPTYGFCWYGEARPPAGTELYTHPADQVADAARWRYYAPKVAHLCGVTLAEMNAEIDADLQANT